METKTGERLEGADDLVQTAAKVANPEVGEEEGRVKKKSLWTRFLIKIGIRSRCCGAKIYYWDTYKPYCTECEKKL